MVLIRLPWFTMVPPEPAYTLIAPVHVASEPIVSAVPELPRLTVPAEEAKAVVPPEKRVPSWAVNRPELGTLKLPCIVTASSVPALEPNVSAPLATVPPLIVPPLSV